MATRLSWRRWSEERNRNRSERKEKENNVKFSKGIAEKQRICYDENRKSLSRANVYPPIQKTKWISSSFLQRRGSH